MIPYIIAAEAISILFSLIIIYATWFETKQRSHKRMAFLAVVILNTMGMASDMFSWMLDGNAMYFEWNYMLTVLSMVFSFAVSAAFVQYIYYYVSEKVTIPRTPFTVITIICLFATAATFVSCLTGATITFVNGIYQEGPYYIYYLIANALGLIFGLIILVISARHLGMHDFIGGLSFIIIPAISMIINVSNEDFAMTYPAIALSIMLVFVMMQAEHEDLILQKERLRQDQSMYDNATGLHNKAAFLDTISHLRSQEYAVAVIRSNINCLRYTNEHYGADAGDQLVAVYTKTVKRFFDKQQIYRLFGGTFVIIVPDVSEEEIIAKLDEMRAYIEKYEVPFAATGYAYGSTQNIHSLVDQAEIAMYAEKNKFYERFPQYTNE